MALNINTNIAALRAQVQLNKTSQGLQKSLERLASGLRINWAADDAAGLAIADSLRATATGLGQAIRNANEGISLIKVADGALIEYGNILNTIKEKVVQAANATQNAETRKSIQKDINKLLAELNTIARTTEFNGQKLLSGSFVNKKFQIGSASYVTAYLSIRSVETNAIGGTKTGVINLNTIGEMQLTITNASTGLQVTTDAINLQYNNNPDNGAGAVANEINRFTGVTGVSAVAIVESTSDTIQAGTITGLKINGVTIGDVTVSKSDADGALQAAINAKELETGVHASVTEDGKLVLTSTDGRAIKVEADSGLVSVLGKTGEELSTLGYIRVIQKGVSDFQIEGIGGDGLGSTFTVASSDTVTIDGDSTLKAGSVIAAGSKIAEGSQLGGSGTLYSAIEANSAITLKANSTVGWGSTLAKGTMITGDVVVAGHYVDSSDCDTVSLEQDMLVKAGTVLKAGTQIGAGTIVYGSLAEALGVNDGTEIGSSGATLSSDVTLDTDIILKYSASANTQIAASSTIAEGSVLGADFTVGYTWSGQIRAVDGSAIDSTSDLLLRSPISSKTDQEFAITATSNGGSATIGEGSMLKDGFRFTFDKSDASGTATLTLDSTATVVIEGKFYDASTGQTSTTTLAAGGTITFNDTGDYFEITKTVYLTSDTSADNSLTMSFQADNMSFELKAPNDTYINGITTSSAQVDGAVFTYADTTTAASITTGSAGEDSFGLSNFDGAIFYNSSASSQTITYTVDSTQSSVNVLTLGAGSILQSGFSITSSGGDDNGEYVVVSVSDGSYSVTFYDASAGTTSTTTLDNSHSLTLYDDDYITFGSDVVLDGNLTVNITNDTTDASQPTATVTVPNYTFIQTYTVDSSNATISSTPSSLTFYEVDTTFNNITLSTNTSTFEADTDLTKDSVLINGSVVKAGTVFGGDAYIGQVTTTEDTTLKQGSVLEGGSSVVGDSVLETDDFITSSDVTLSDDMTVAAGTTLKSGTKLAKGTVVQQDMTLYTQSSGGTAVTVTAGSTLDQDLYLQSDVTLTADMLLADGSIIESGSELVLKPTGEMSDIETKQLSDLYVLDYESAQIAVTIVEAAIADVDGVRSDLGSVQNQLESTVKNISVTQVNVQAAEASIREVDFAAESANFTRMQVLMQAGMFALAQSNTLPQMAIQLLQG